jgi:hypothetical protein
LLSDKFDILILFYFAEGERLAREAAAKDIVAGLGGALGGSG